MIGGEAVVEDVTVSITGDAASGAWGGYVFLAPGAEVSEGEYVLRLDDGRAGKVLFISIKGYIARFRGLGPLAQS